MSRVTLAEGAALLQKYHAFHLTPELALQSPNLVTQLSGLDAQLRACLQGGILASAWHSGRALSRIAAESDSCNPMTAWRDVAGAAGATVRTESDCFMSAATQRADHHLAGHLELALKHGYVINQLVTLALQRHHRGPSTHLP